MHRGSPGPGLKTTVLKNPLLGATFLFQYKCLVAIFASSPLSVKPFTWNLYLSEVKCLPYWEAVVSSHTGAILEGARSRCGPGPGLGNSASGFRLVSTEMPTFHQLPVSPWKTIIHVSILSSWLYLPLVQGDTGRRMLPPVLWYTLCC